MFEANTRKMAVSRVTTVMTTEVPIVRIGGSELRLVISAARIATVAIILASWCAAPFPCADQHVAGHIGKVRIGSAARSSVRINFT